MDRYRAPEEHRLELSGGDYLIVRKHLTAGEARDIQTKIMKVVTTTGKPELVVDPAQVNLSEMVIYLLDWSITKGGKKVEILDQPYDVVAAALLNQDPESFEEIRDAIDAHDKAMKAEREFQKKMRSGETAPSSTSGSAA
jgi:hypothetical protein